MEIKKPTPKEALFTLWRRGVIHWKLHEVQKRMYNSINDFNKEITVITCARRLGKSYLLCVLSVEQCLKKPDSIVKYVCPKQDMVQKIIKPIMQDIFKDCPPELRPEYKTNAKMYLFPNGSQIQIAGTDNGHYQSLRGGKSDLWIVDEAGFCDELKDIVNSVLAPTADTTGGRGILASTPSPKPDHEFITEFVQPNELTGELIKYTLFDNPMMTPEKRQKIINRYPLKEKDDDFRREYLCEIIIDSEKAVIPEFTTAIQEKCIKAWPRPPFYDAYVSMDIGFDDLTVVLFGYYDFKNAVTVIEDEFYIKGQALRTDVLAKEIKKKEQKVYSNPASGEYKEPYLRVSDNNNLILLNDLNYKHNLLFIPTAKDNKDAALNNLRMRIASEKIIIHPRCKVLIHHLKNATWDKNRKKYVKSPAVTLYDEENNTIFIPSGHYDACFLPGQKVLTNAGYKKIEDIVIGDQVLTHQGRFKKVTNTMNRDYSGEICDIKVPGRELMQCTPNHRLYVGNVEKNRKEGFTGQKIITGTNWSPAAELNFENHKAYIPFIEEGNINITKELCFLYGYYVAEGSVGGNGHQISFAGHKREKNVLGILEKAVHNTYGKGKRGVSRRSINRHKNGECKPRSTKARYYKKDSDNGRIICVTQSELRSELKKLGTSTQKHFPPFIYDLNKEQSMYMLLGYLFGDGYFSKTGIIGNSISKEIIHGVDILSRKLGLVGNITFQKREGRWKSSPSAKDQYIWHLDKQQAIDLITNINKNEDLAYIFEDKLIHDIISKNKYNYPSNFKKLTKSESLYTGKVYNLEVEEDNSYTVNDIAVHNCDAITYFIRNVQESKNPYPPGYGLGENKDLFIKTNAEKNKEYEAFINIFKPRSSLKKH